MIKRWLGKISTLILSAIIFFPMCASAKPYKGAEYRTKASYLYGKFETRIKANGREGMLTSFFTYNGNYPSTPWNEIDIEIMGRYTDDVQFNPITPGQTNHVSHQHVSFNPALDYHVYGFEWTPTYVAWFIDSVEVYRQTGAHIATLNIAQKIMMNVWPPVYTNWAGVWNDAVLPAFAYYDWVKYASYTPGSGTYGTDNNFTPQWMDNFDSWDQTRWDKATHTFDGNNCDFVHANAVFQNGKLILCLTKETAVGYVDNVAPLPLWARAEGNIVRLMFAEEVEQASAEATANYLVPSASVTNAQLLPDLKTVLLTATGLDTTTTSAIIVQNISDRWTIPNVSPQRAVSLIRQTPLTFPLKINIGGPAYQGYLPDQEWSATGEYGRIDGAAGYFSGVTISGTTEPEVYRSEISDLCEYKVRVPNGRYAIVLMMAENYFTSANQRKFSLVVEGTQVHAGLDLYSVVGFRAAYQRAAFVDVADGVLDIHVQGLIDKPLLNGITITSLGTDVKGSNEFGFPSDSYKLYTNYPNPFNGGTNIHFSIPQEDQLMFKVFDTLGRNVSERSLGFFQKGEAQIFWNAISESGVTLPSGVYFYRIEGRQMSAVQKMIYLK